MRMGHDAVELGVRRGLGIVEELAVELVLPIPEPCDRVRVRPRTRMAENTPYVDVRTAVEGGQFARLDVHGPQAGLVLAVVRDHVEVVRTLDIEAHRPERLEAVLMIAMDLGPTGRAPLAVVQHVFPAALVEAAGQPRVAFAVELDLAERHLAADQEAPAASPQVELVVGERPVRLADARCRAVLPALADRDDHFVGLARQDVVHEHPFARERPHFLRIDIQHREPVLVHALVESVDLVADFLAQREQDVAVARPVEANDLHRIGVQPKRLFGEVCGVVDFDDRIAVPRRDLHQRQVLAVRRDGDVADHRTHRPVLQGVGLDRRGGRGLVGGERRARQERG